MNISSLDKWFVEINEEEKEFPSIAEVLEVLKSVENLETCKVWVGKDCGPSPWWHRLLGTQKRFTVSVVV